MAEKKYLIVIGGPTAVGKSDLAIDLAKTYHCDIVSADSRQFYKEMKIGTARLTSDEMEGVNHHFIGHLSVDNDYSVGDFESEVMAFLDHYFTDHQIAILCGGTGLFLEAICNGLDDFPEVSTALRETLELELKEKGIEALQQELLTADPDYYQRVDLKNPRRLVRALSVIRSSGKPFSSFLNQQKPGRNFIPIRIALKMNRELLYHKINARVDTMMEQGLLEEAQNLYPKRKLNALQTVGYSELFRYLDGDIGLPEAIEEIKKNSRRYAKRQTTWFKNQGAWEHFTNDDVEGIKKHITNYLNMK